MITNVLHSLALDFSAIDWTLTGTVTLAGLLIVFVVLVLLVGLFYLFGRVFSGKPKKEKVKVVKNENSKKTAPLPPPAPVVEQGISGEVVAAIAAAIACCEGSGQYVIKSIRRQHTTGRPAWASAGIAENTRPF